MYRHHLTGQRIKNTHASVARTAYIYRVLDNPTAPAHERIRMLHAMHDLELSGEHPSLYDLLRAGKTVRVDEPVHVIAHGNAEQGLFITRTAAGAYVNVHGRTVIADLREVFPTPSATLIESDEPAPTSSAVRDWLLFDKNTPYNVRALLAEARQRRAGTPDSIRRAEKIDREMAGVVTYADIMPDLCVRPDSRCLVLHRGDAVPATIVSYPGGASDDRIVWVWRDGADNKERAGLDTVYPAPGTIIRFEVNER